MAPTTDPKVEKAVQYVVQAGMSARWEKAGKPNGETGIQNIRKHARQRQAKAKLVGPLALMGPSQ